MKIGIRFGLACVAIGLAIAVGGTAIAQEMQGRTGTGMMQGDTPSGMMAGVQGGIDQGMNMTRRGMARGMMCPMMAAMMQDDHSGMMGTNMQGGMGALFGSRVTPVMNLSVDDVRGYLAVQLERLNNKRLKIGSINSGDGDITAEVVTVDNSLVQRLKVDRHTGAITYEN
jgi:hypothetical protein